MPPRDPWTLLAEAAALLALLGSRSSDPDLARRAEELVSEIDRARRGEPGAEARRRAL